MEDEPDREVIDELTMLADELLRQAASIRSQWEELGEALGVDLSAAAAATPPAPALANGTDRAPAAPAPAEPPAPARPAPPVQPADPDPGADPLRLVALDMMLSGRSREEVEEYLRVTFGDDIDARVVDDVFNADG